MNYLRLMIAAVLGTAVLFSGTSVQALPLFDFTSGSQIDAPTSPHTLGYSFKVTGDITVDGIGLFDSDGLDSAHEVALWNITGGTPLVEVLFTPGSTGTGSDPSISGQGNYVYMNITPLILATGDYVLGASYLRNPANKDEVINTVVPPITENAGNVEYGVGRFMFGTGVNVKFPLFDDVENDYFGPALRIQATIPEPLTLALLVIGIVGIGCCRRQRSPLSGSIAA